jgi:hypothetical protein
VLVLALYFCIMRGRICKVFLSCSLPHLIGVDVPRKYRCTGYLVS